MTDLEGKRISDNYFAEVDFCEEMEKIITENDSYDFVDLRQLEFVKDSLQ